MRSRSHSVRSRCPWFWCKLAVQGRYKVNLFLCVLIGSLQALQSDRRLVITSYSSLFAPFTAVTRVQIPSGTPNLFSDLRGIAHCLEGTKRNSFRPELAVQLSENTDLSRMSNLFLKAQKGTSAATAAQPPREPEARNSRITSV